MMTSSSTNQTTIVVNTQNRVKRESFKICLYRHELNETNYNVG